MPHLQFLIRCFWLASLLTNLPKAAFAQGEYHFISIAGTGPFATSVTVPLARLNLPTKLAVDSRGNVYVSDYFRHVIRRISDTGSVTTIAGTGGVSGSVDGVGMAARFNNPQGLAADSSGNLYVADSSNYVIRRISSSGAVSTLAGTAGQRGNANGVGAAARFGVVYDLAVDAAGNVYVCEWDNSTIRKITPSGMVTTLAGQAGQSGSADGTGAAARFLAPRGIAVDESGTVLVADTGNHTIRRVSPSGVVTTLAGRAQLAGMQDGVGEAARFNLPFGIKVDRSGTLWIADRQNHVIRRIKPDGSVSTFAGRSGETGAEQGTAAQARFSGPTGLALDAAHNILVADRENHTLRKITPQGGVSLLAGVPGDTGFNDGRGVQFQSPSGIVVDSGGDLLVADEGGHAIRRITPSGVFTTFAGAIPGTQAPSGAVNGTGTGARFNTPAGVTTDGLGNAYVADSGNHTIRKITPAGVVTTLAGAAGQQGAANGQGASARFTGPRGVAVDNSGNVYVADTGNHAVRKVTPAGMVSTLAGLPGTRGINDGIGAVARFNGPSGLVVDEAGNVYVADTDNHTIRRVTAAGLTSTVAGRAGSAGNTDGSGGAARLYSPNSIVRDGSGHLLVTSIYTPVKRISLDGTIATLGPANPLAPGGGYVAPGSPSGIAVGPGDLIYVSDLTNRVWMGFRAPSPPAAFLGNLSVRGLSGTGDSTLIVGVTVSGGAENERKSLLIRGVGPSLTSFGVGGVLADPVLTVFHNAVQVAGNDDWSNQAEMIAAFGAVGAFPLLPGSRDAALFSNGFGRGSLTVQLTGKGISQGNALIELYDADPAAAQLTVPRFSNLSARTFGGSGDETLIVGFNVAGTGSTRVVIRAVGPGLAPFGISGTIPDPRLELFAGAARLAQNDDWEVETEAVQGQAGAFRLAPGSRDAAIVATLGPGSYTARASGSASGIVLVEIYVVP